MLFLEKLFKKRLPQAVVAAPDSDAKAISQLATPEEYQSLRYLQNQRQLLEVKITGSTRSYQSMIVAIDLERGLLWLDDLFPQQRVLDPGDELCIRHHRNTEELVIHAPIVALGSSYGTSGIAVVLPNFAYYQPRRRFPRYKVGHQSPLSVKIRPLGQEPSYGTLQDISVGGMRLMVAGNLLSQLRHDAVMPLCEINLTEDLQIRCRARICAFRVGRTPYRHTQISIEFIDLLEEKRIALGRFLCQQQFNISVELNTIHPHHPHIANGERALAA